jgi:hypothetical protein
MVNVPSKGIWILGCPQVVSAPTSAGVNLSQRKRGAGINMVTFLLDSRLRENDKTCALASSQGGAKRCVGGK